jgi:hypothetical protein
MSEPREWADAIGLDVGGKPGWLVGFAIETTGELPKWTWSGYTTRFELSVSRTMWSVRVSRRAGMIITHVWRPRGRAYTYDGALVKPPKKLATIGQWLAKVERELRIRFRRDRPTIHSNVKGGAQTIARWCMLGMPRHERLGVRISR